VIHGAGSAGTGTPGRALIKDGSAVQSPAGTLTVDTVNSSSNTANGDSNSSSSSGSGNNTAWTFGERIAVLAGLCEVLKASTAAAEVFTKVKYNHQLTYYCTSYRIIPYCIIPRCQIQHNTLIY
jgi:hypothetical protein